MEQDQGQEAGSKEYAGFLAEKPQTEENAGQPVLLIKKCQDCGHAE